MEPLPLLRGAPNATEAWRRDRRKRRRPDRPSEGHLYSDRHAPSAVPSVKAQHSTDHTRKKKLHLKWRPLVEDVCCTTYVIASGTVQALPETQGDSRAMLGCQGPHVARAPHKAPQMAVQQHPAISQTAGTVLSFKKRLLTCSHWWGFRKTGNLDPSKLSGFTRVEIA